MNLWSSRPALVLAANAVTDLLRSLLYLFKFLCNRLQGMLHPGAGGSDEKIKAPDFTVHTIA
jgi:hypothetical protein